MPDISKLKEVWKTHQITAVNKVYFIFENEINSVSVSKAKIHVFIAIALMYSR